MLRFMGARKRKSRHLCCVFTLALSSRSIRQGCSSSTVTREHIMPLASESPRSVPISNCMHISARKPTIVVSALDATALADFGIAAARACFGSHVVRSSSRYWCSRKMA